jgi:CTP synthase
MEEQKSVSKKGGTMRLGAYPCSVAKGTLAYAAYNATDISERHRHRYEFNNKFRSVLTEKGMILSGIYKEKDLVEIIELPDHPWFLGCQFHPEFKSKPLQPHPLFRAFIGAALAYRATR